jgi:hypothetical protein
MRIPRSSAIFLAAVVAMATTAIDAGVPTVLTARNDFDARTLLKPGSWTPGSTGSTSSFRAGVPGRFSMHQSYSLTAMSGPSGSMSSGLYLNTLMYRLSTPLTVFADVGFHSPIHSSMPGLQQEGGPGSLVFPRLGLEYKPNERLTMNLELVNGADAWKAYGGMPRSSLFFPGSLSP